MSKSKKTYTVVRQEWLESERGWGIRPDGYSLHRSVEDCAQYIREYWARMPSYVPDEYSRPDGGPTPVTVDKKTYDAVSASDCGLRFFR